MKYWIIRNMDDELIAVTEEEPEAGVTQDTNGVHTLQIKNASSHSGYDIFYRRGILDNEHTSVWKPAFVVKEISKAEYETYKEFGI